MVISFAVVIDSVSVVRMVKGRGVVVGVLVEMSIVSGTVVVMEDVVSGRIIDECFSVVEV